MRRDPATAMWWVDRRKGGVWFHRIAFRKFSEAIAYADFHARFITGFTSCPIPRKV